MVRVMRMLAQLGKREDMHVTPVLDLPGLSNSSVWICHVFVRQPNVW